MSTIYGDTNNQPVSLTGNQPGSLGYEIAEIENHLHAPEQVYGLTANTMARKAVTPIIITGGNGAWGTELELHNGATIESGSATKYFDFHKIAITAVGTANRVTALEFYSTSRGTPIAATTQIAADTLTIAGTPPVNGTKVSLDTIVTSTNINTYTYYYVVGAAAHTFQLSLTVGGAAVDIQTNDGTCNFAVLTQTLITETIVSRAATSTDSLYVHMNCARTTCNKRVSCRGWAAGGTNAISFFIGLHTYVA